MLCPISSRYITDIVPTVNSLKYWISTNQMKAEVNTELIVVCLLSVKVECVCVW